MVSSFSATQQQGLLGAFLLLVPSVVLSGFATPIDNMPGIVQQFTMLNPLRHFLIILRGVFLKGLTVDLLWPQYWPMALIGLTALMLARCTVQEAYILGFSRPAAGVMEGHAPGLWSEPAPCLAA